MLDENSSNKSLVYFELTGSTIFIDVTDFKSTSTIEEHNVYEKILKSGNALTVKQFRASPPRKIKWGSKIVINLKCINIRQ